jgi:uncharacterized membrane protein YsdA (DUF1294 family)
VPFTNTPIINLAGSITIACISYWLAYLFFRLIIDIFCSDITAKWLAHGLVAAIALGGLLAMLITHLHPAAQQHLLWFMLIGTLIAINLIITPCYYWFDKRASQQSDNRRIAETVLHTLAFAGGGISAFISQRVFRHKTQKKAFKLMTPAGILSSLLMIYLLMHFSPVFS